MDLRDKIIESFKKPRYLNLLKLSIEIDEDPIEVAREFTKLVRENIIIGR